MKVVKITDVIGTKVYTDFGDYFGEIEEANLFENKVGNVLEARIIEPYQIKRQAISSASEVACMILRIDDVIAARPDKKGKMNFTGKEMDYPGGL